MTENLFDIHPHTGYLNTDFEISNNSDNPILIFDEIGEKTSVLVNLLPNKSYDLKLSAGSHTIFAESHNGFQQSEIINVEDAIKLGGGKETAAYVSEKSNWALIKMTDRLYFHNIKTGEEYTEINLVPDSIDFFCNDIAIFYTKNEGYSLYTLNSNRTIFRSDNGPLYLNDSCILFSSEIISGSKLLSLISNTGEVQSIAFDEFTINSMIDELYVYSKGVIEVYSLKDLNIKQSITPSLDYIEFVGSGYYLAKEKTDYRTMFILYDIRQGKNDKVGEIRDAKKFTKVINKKLISDETWNQIVKEQAEVSQSFSSETRNFVSLVVFHKEISDFFFIGDLIYYRLLEISGLDRNSVQTTSLCRIDNGNIIPIQNNYQVFVKNGVLIAQNDKNGIIISQDGTVVSSDAKIYSIKGKLAKIQLKENGNKSITGLDGNLIFDGKFEDDYIFSENRVFKNVLAEYGFIILANQYRDLKILSITGGNVMSQFQSMRLLSNKVLFSSNDNISILKEDGTFRDLSSVCVNVNHILAISNGLDYIITCDKNNHGSITMIYCCKWDNTTSIYSKEQILADKFDTSIYGNVLFAGDGSHIIYSDSEGSFYSRNLNTGNVEVFKNEKYLQHINGYRSEIIFVGNSSANPRTIDPVTGQYLDAVKLSNYKFSSPDSLLTVEKPPIADIAPDGVGSVEYIHKRTNLSYTKDQYYELSQKYNTSKLVDADEKLANLRIEYMKTEAQLFAKAITNNIKNTIRFRDVEILPLDIIQYSSIASSSNSINVKKEAIEYFAKFTHDFIGYVINKQEYIIVHNRETQKNTKIVLGTPLWFLNYMSFSYDSRYIAIAGRYPDNTCSEDGHCIGGLFYLYDIQNETTVAMSTNTNAVWVSAFTKDGTIAYYDSSPNTFLRPTTNASPLTIKERNFLTFSPSGKLFAMSNQGYVRWDKATHMPGGHQPSTNVYLRRVDQPEEELAKYNDHGSQISNTRTKNVCMVAFSRDDSKMLSVSDDGVVVIRNLHIFDKQSQCEN